MFTDTHCHIYREYYDDIDNLQDKFLEYGVNRVINNGCNDSSNIEVLEHINNYDYMYGALGIHPEYADSYALDDIEFIKQHIVDKKVIAIGEIGLDYHYTNENKAKQIELFELQLKLAEEFNKPVIIHSRDATEDTINILKKYKVKGVIHSFSGSYETAREYIKMGFLLGINGVITFKNCNLKDVLKRLELKDIVLETDSPYLTPVPYRGEKNDSSHIKDIALFISDFLGIDIETLAMETNGNIKRCFDI